MSTLTALAQAELAQLEAELPRLEIRLREAEADYDRETPRFDEWRTKDPRQREQEILMIHRVGIAQEAIRSTRERIAFLRRL